MSGKAKAVESGGALVQEVVALAEKLGLEAHPQYRAGRRIWGAVRFIDVVVTSPKDRRRLGIECKVQSVSGSAEEKIPATLQDLAAWPIAGIVTFAGKGFSPNMRSYLIASGKAVAFEDLEAWMRLYFGLELNA